MYISMFKVLITNCIQHIFKNKMLENFVTDILTREWNNAQWSIACMHLSLWPFSRNRLNYPSNSPPPAHLYSSLKSPHFPCCMLPVSPPRSCLMLPPVPQTPLITVSTWSGHSKAARLSEREPLVLSSFLTLHTDMKLWDMRGTLVECYASSFVLHQPLGINVT